MTYRNRVSVLAAAGPLAATVLLVGCLHGGAAPAPVADQGAAQATPMAARVTLENHDGYTRGLGSAGGAFFEVIRPDKWNGDLVLLMQGQFPPGPPMVRNPLMWQTEGAIRDLIARGYGIALSGYRKQSPVEGALDMRVAEATFTSQFGKPNATYLWGWSMGGAIGHLLLEQGAGRYAGFLSICSDQVGALPLYQYWLDAWTIFNYYFPGALPWKLGSGDADWFTEVLPAFQKTFAADPPGFIAKVTKMASIDQLRLPLGDRAPRNYVLTVFAATLQFAGGGARTIENFHGLPVGNTGRVYTSDLLSADELADLNANVRRFSADRDAAQRMARFTATGRTHHTPILAVHTDGDPALPVWIPRMYTAVAEAAGEGDRYVLRVIPGFGHCQTTPTVKPDGFDEVQIRAFDELVKWVKQGVKPVP